VTAQPGPTDAPACRRVKLMRCSIPIAAVQHRHGDRSKNDRCRKQDADGQRLAQEYGSQQHGHNGVNIGAGRRITTKRNYSPQPMAGRSFAAGRSRSTARQHRLGAWIPLVGRVIRSTHPNSASQGLLFMATFLAGVFHPAMAHVPCNAIGRTALTACHVQPGLAPRDGHVPCQRLSHQAFGLLAHSFL
jgi:hypothetical protein